MTEQSKSIKMLRIEQVQEKVGYKKSTIFEWMKAGSLRYKSHFPLPRKNGRSNRWFESEIDDFCILEFGGSINHPNVERGRAVNDGKEGAGISAPHPGDAIKTETKSKVPSEKSRLELANISGESAFAEQDADPPRSEVAENLDAPQTVDTQQLAVAAQNANPNGSDDGIGVTLVEEIGTSSLPATPVPTKNATATITQTDASRPTRVIKVVVTKRHSLIHKLNRERTK